MTAPGERHSGSVRAAVASAVAVDRSGFAPLLAIRAAAGVAIPIAIGAAAGHPAEGVIAAAGALPAGVAGLAGATGSGARVMAATASGMAISTFVGGLSAGHLAATLVVLAAWGFAAGLTVVLGRNAAVVGTQAVMGLVVFGRFPGGVATSAGHAGWVLAGAGLQGLLAVVIRSPRPFAGERKVLADGYAELARMARDPQRSGLAAASMTATAMSLIERRGPGEAADLLRGLAHESDRIRLELQALATVSQVDGVREAMTASAQWLVGIGESIHSNRPCPAEPPGLDAAQAQLRAARDAAPAGRRGTPARYAAARSAALAGQLRAAARLTTALAGIRRVGLPRGTGKVPAVVTLPRRTASAAQRLLTAAMTPTTAAFRHAVRLAVLLPAAEALSRALPWQRGYWVTLTALVVLKPDYAATAQRGIARIVGTGIGVLAAGLLVETLHPNGAALSVLTAAVAWTAYACFNASYALYSMSITALVVLLLAPLGGNDLSTVADRGLDTLIGGGLAMAGYLLWPTWEGGTLSGAVDELLLALAAYSDAVLTRYVDPDGSEPTAVAVTAGAARRARIEATASLTRAMAEPARGGADATTAAGRLAAARRIVIALHALRATVDDAMEHVPVPEVSDLRDAIVAALRALAQHQSPDVSRLREMQEALDAEVPGDPTGLHARRLSLLAAHLDPLVDSVDTLAHVMSEGSAQPAHG
ncbi:MAG TPA: FUSC family protein [Mycobacteriales bacterium]|nr:FUSC family protein [Mycobacteriales bacterium]